jgi:hypothetical protein
VAFSKANKMRKPLTVNIFLFSFLLAVLGHFCSGYNSANNIVADQHNQPRKSHFSALSSAFARNTSVALSGGGGRGVSGRGGLAPGHKKGFAGRTGKQNTTGKKNAGKQQKQSTTGKKNAEASPKAEKNS